MFPGTLSKDNVDGRHYNSNLNIAFVFETFVPFNICLAFGDVRSEHWKRANLSEWLLLLRLSWTLKDVILVGWLISATLHNTINQKVTNGRGVPLGQVSK